MHPSIPLFGRPALLQLMPKKKMLNRILFDHDSRLNYSKVLKVYQSLYDNLDNPDDIKLPNFVKSDDLMVLRQVLSSIRKSTNTINRNLVDLENELLEQASELGNNDAIAFLAFNTIQDKTASKADFRHANSLIDQLSKLNHPLTFKLGGDLAYKNRLFDQAKHYWLQFLDLENNTTNASHVYSNLGIYYYTLNPRPDLMKARLYLKQSITFGILDPTILRAHYYYSQLFTLTDPKVSKYHLEICASQGLKESFSSLGFLEMNVFGDYVKSLEWFKLGHEADGDLSCLIGQFDCFLLIKDIKLARTIVHKIMSIKDKIQKVNYNDAPDSIKATINTNNALLDMFFSTRQSGIKLTATQIF